MRLFEKRGFFWVDYVAGDKRRRVTTGVPISDGESRAWAAVPARIAQASVPTSTTTVGVEPTPIVGVTLQEAFKLAMMRRKTWKGAKRKDSIFDLYQAVEDRFGPDRVLATITTDDLDKWVEYMEKEEPGKRLLGDGRHETGLSPSTINHRLSCLSVLFKESKVQLPVIPRQPVNDGRVRTFTEQEISRILGWLERSSLKGAGELAALSRFLLGTAVRMSEALKLEDRDVDIVERTATFWDTKNGTDRRLPLEGPVWDIVGPRLGQGRPFGSRLTVDRIYDIWEKMREDLGYAHDFEFVPHSLRHTAITTLAGMGHNDLTIMEFAGHRQIETTRRYTHLGKKHLRSLGVSLAGTLQT